MAEKNFRVIVVGGGPVGLTIAHTLSKAGIDFIVLERRPMIGEDGGASIILSPHGLRIMAQVGLLDHLSTISAETVQNRYNTDDGRIYKESEGFGKFKEL